MESKYTYSVKHILAGIFVFLSVSSYSDQPVAPKHNFYLSICEMVYKQETATLQISLRFFTDDIEKAILHYNNTSIISKLGGKTKQSAQSLFSYLKDNFSIYPDENNKAEFEFVGWEIEGGVAWCYLETKIKFLKKLKVENKLLTEIYPSQKNLVYLKSGSNETSILLDKDKIVDVLVIK